MVESGHDAIDRLTHLDACAGWHMGRDCGYPADFRASLSQPDCAVVACCLACSVVFDWIGHEYAGCFDDP